MPRLKAATVSDQTVKRKRKRDTCGGHGEEDAAIVASDSVTLEPTVDTSGNITDDATTTTVPTKTHDGGKKPRRTAKKSAAGKPALVRHASSTIVETTIPWPEHFTKLAQVHRALNLVYTFCCTRKHLATTLDNLKARAGY
jgi:DEAD/DEAH box helicase domain-containing protein